jgi:hypothetical protein
MKKNLVSLAVAASVAASASAVVQAQQYVNPEKTGQVILFPFYNADNGNATNFHIVNTTKDVKAVKIRFVEYKNSDEVLDFNLYLSKEDHFAFGVIKDPNGDGAAVITADNSCTVPALGSPNGAYPGTATEQADGSIVRIQPFVNYQYDDDFDDSIERTMMGHVEVIEMGVVNNPDGATIKDGNAYKSAATHGPTGVPASCALLEKAWAAGAWAGETPDNSMISAPEGGLYGLAYHINVEDAASFGFEPVAIDNWRTTQIHTNPGTNSPSLSDGVTTVVYHHGEASDYYEELTMPSGEEATSVALMTTRIENDVMINPALGGETDWVITWPTKRLHVDLDELPAVIPPFTDGWTGEVGTTTKKEDPACEPVAIEQWDREEAITTPVNGFSPSPDAVTNKICNEVAVVGMGTGVTSALSVTTGFTEVTFPYSEGWQRFSFNDDDQATRAAVGTNTGTQLLGLPTVGFAAYKVNNGAMSYGNAAEHKTQQVASGGSTAS